MTFIGRFRDIKDAEAALIRFSIVFTKMNISDEDLVEYFGIESGFAQAHAEIEEILNRQAETIDKMIVARKELEKMVAKIEEDIRRQDNARWN